MAERSPSPNKQELRIKRHQRPPSRRNDPGMGWMGSQVGLEAKTPIGRTCTIEELTGEAVKEAAYVLKLISILQSKIASRVRKCFHPPLIVKDADAIMKRSLKRLVMIKDNLFQTAITRWYYKTKIATRMKKTGLLLHVLQIAQIGMNQAVEQWKGVIHKEKI